MDNSARNAASDLRLDLLERFEASAFLPAAMADSTSLTKVRMRLIREWLIVARLALRRMRFLACGVFAMNSSLLE